MTENKKQDKTTIQITKEIRDKLGTIGMMSETYDDVLRRLIILWEDSRKV